MCARSVPATATQQRHGRQFDVRRSDQAFATGRHAAQRPAAAPVSTDCPAAHRARPIGDARARCRRDFRAFQTGVFVPGVARAVVADFISGAVEWLAPAAAASHWDLIEGQGSLFHPSFAGVSLGLLHGAQADTFVVCHEPTRKTMRGVQHALPTIAEVIDLTVRCGRLTNPDIRPVGIAINTQALAEDDARALLAQAAHEHGLPATDPVRFGVEAIVDRLLAEFPASAPRTARSAAERGDEHA
jgi:hypothetical protein